MKKRGNKGRNTVGEVVRIPVSQREWERGLAGVSDCDRGPYHALQHRPVMRVEHAEEGRRRTVTKVLPISGRLFRAGVIDEAMLYEASEFKTIYDIARLDGMRIPEMGRLSGGGGKAVDQSARIIDARDRLWRIYALLGGPTSRMALALDKIIGQEMNVTAAADTRGRARDGWQTSLVNALQVLVSYRQGHWKKCA